MIEMVRTLEGLESLPMYAVVESRNNVVLQKFASGWLSPGDPRWFDCSDIGLPARLLDDGR